MTLYGPGSGMLLVHELAVQAGAKTAGRWGTRTYRYAAGPERRFGPEVLRVEPGRPDEGLAATVQDPATGRPVRDYPTFVWTGKRAGGDERAALPQVRVEEEGGGRWEVARAGGVPQTDAGPDLAVVLLRAGPPLLALGRDLDGTGRGPGRGPVPLCRAHERRGASVLRPLSRRRGPPGRWAGRARPVQGRRTGCRGTVRGPALPAAETPTEDSAALRGGTFQLARDHSP